MTMPKLDQTQKEVPIMKDFSIDFIAKALEDLNLGGNGDISQYRKSVLNGLLLYMFEGSLIHGV